MAYKVFVDGQEGTTGLRIRHYLSNRTDIEILDIDPDKRKDVQERSNYLNEADIVFLCLPDSAAVEAVELVKNDRTKIINTSTAFRTDKNWVYGLPELNNQRDEIRGSSRVSVPGCHPTGFILTLRPLIEAGIVPRDYPVSCYSVTGYSGAGKSGIEEYENEAAFIAKQLNVPRHYALQGKHKHLPEMKLYAGLQFEPLFTPIIASYAQGIAMSIPLISRCLAKKASAQEVHDVLARCYEAERYVRVMPYDSSEHLDEGQFKITACTNTNFVDIFVFGDDDNIQIMSRYDNLGKGASGAAVQNMNLMLGVDEGAGI